METSVVTLFFPCRCIWDVGYYGQNRTDLEKPPLSNRDRGASDLAVISLNLTLREVEEVLLECGIVVSYETIRRRC